jgi:hypothetical protein
MLTAMTEEDWRIVLRVFAASRSPRNFETLLDIGPDINPRAALGDKGYDYGSFVALALGFILIKSVHTA